MNRLKKYFSGINIYEFLALIGILIWLLIFDILSKYYAYNNMIDHRGEVYTAIPGLFNFTLVFNTGAAWNTLAGMKWLLSLVSLIATLLLLFFLFYKYKKIPRSIRYCLILMIAGACGNMIDRMGYWANFGIYQYGVIDFIQFAFWPSFPIFNLADSYLVIGIFACAISYIIYLVKNRKEREKAISETSEDDLASKLKNKDDNDKLSE